MEGIREAGFCSRSHRLLSIAFVALILFAAAGQAVAQGFAHAIPGKNVDVVGPTQPNTGHAGDVLMQQNEIAGGTSLWKPKVQYAAFNDYRLVNHPLGGDAVIGFAYSTTGGRIWNSFAHPGFSIDDPTNPPGGADANIVVLPGRQGGGVVLVHHMAFWRDDSQPAQLRTGIWYEHNRATGPPATFLGNWTNTTGTSGQFHDKPSFEGMLWDPADPRPDIKIPIPPFTGPAGSGASHGGYDLPIPAARVHACFTKFVGNADGTKVECQFTDDAAMSWSKELKLSSSVEINQGTSIALQDFGRIMTVCWTRFEDNNETAAVMCAKSIDSGETFSSAEVATEFCPYNAPTGPARFRSNSLPIVVARGDEPGDVAIFFASRNDAMGPCNIPGKGNKADETGFSPVRFIDDFDTFGEVPARNEDGSRNKDGLVRTSRNFARIMMLSQKPNGQWDNKNVVMVDPQLNIEGDVSSGRKNFHQIMPACEAAGGIFTCTSFDTRLDRLNNLGSPITSGFIEDAVLHLDKDEDGNIVSGTVLPAGLYDLVPPPALLPPAVNNFPLRRRLNLHEFQVDDNGIREHLVDPDTWYADSGPNSIPSPSLRVSRFATRQKPEGEPGEREEIEQSYGGARLFNKGLAPFMSDYNGVWALLAKQQYQADGTVEWVPAHGAPNLATDLFPSTEPVFNMGWTSNHKVKGKVFYTGCDVWSEELQMWQAGDGCASPHTAPEVPEVPGAMMPLVGEDAGEGLPMSCSAAQFLGLPTGPLTRNQTVMFAALNPAIHAEVVSAIKPPLGMINTFVLSISNGTKTDRTVTLSLPLAPTLMSFDKTGPDTQPSIDVVVPRGSSNARTVFDFANAGEGTPSVILTVSDKISGEVLANVLLNRESLAPLENVRSNDPNDPFDLIGDGEFYELILKRETSTTQSLDLENLDFENSTVLLDFENLDLENLDFENQLVFLDFENLDLENILVDNLDLENSLYANLDLENIVVNLDLENLDLENRLLYLDLENLDLENDLLKFLDFENLDLENLEFASFPRILDLENLDFENLDFENVTTFASDIENLDFENLDLENTTPATSGVPYTEVSWTADSANNTATGVDIQPIFSQQFVDEMADAGTTVLLTVRQGYMTPTVSTIPNLAGPEVPFCTVQLTVQNQIVYAAVLTGPQVLAAIFDGSVEDPAPLAEFTPGFVSLPDASYVTTLTFFNPPNLDAELHSGMSLFTQAGNTANCDNDEIDGVDLLDSCEFDFPDPDTTEPVISGIPSDPPPDSPFALDPDSSTFRYEVSGISASDEIDGPVDVVCTPGTRLDPDPDPFTFFWDFEVGLTTVTCTATDEAGNTATASFTAEVVDETPPVVTINVSDNGLPVEGNILGGASISFSASATDVVSGSADTSCWVDGSQVTSPHVFGVGSNDLTCIATDDANVQGSATATVTVVDTTAPDVTIIVLDSMPAEATDPGGAMVSFSASSNDVVSGPVGTSCSVLVIEPVMSPHLFGVGDTVLTCTATDDAGIQGSATTAVTVVDTTAPVVTISVSDNDLPVEGDILGGASISFSASATDVASDGSLVTSCSVPGVDPVISPYLFGVGDTVLTCTATDDAGIQGSATATVTVVDSTTPVVTFGEDPISRSTTDQFLSIDYLSNVSAIDSVSGAVTPVCTVDGMSQPNPYDFPVDTTSVVSCTATDGVNNSSPETFDVIVSYSYNVTIVFPKGNIRAGSTIPVDVYYTDPLNDNIRVDPTDLVTEVRWFGPWQNNDCTGENAGEGAGEATNDAGNSNFRPNLAQLIMQYSWQTPEQAGPYTFTVFAPGTANSTECIVTR